MNREGLRATVMGGLTGGIFLIGLAFAFLSGHFLTFFLVDLAVCSLTGGLTTTDIQANYGGFQGFVFLMGLAVLSLIGFWPWILVLLGISSILGALSGPGIVTLVGWVAQTRTPAQPRRAPIQPRQARQNTYPPIAIPQSPRTYQQGYQPEQEMYEEGNQQFIYPGQTGYEDVQAQYPQNPQQIPPQQ